MLYKNNDKTQEKKDNLIEYEDSRWIKDKNKKNN